MGLFNRKNKIDESYFLHIKAQNEFIEQNDEKISEQEEYLRELRRSIERVLIEHPDVTENIALWRSSNELRFYLQQAQIELDTKEKQLDMIGQAKEEQLEVLLKEKKLELLKLEQEIAEKKEKRNSNRLFNLSDLYICSYKVTNINDIAVGIFHKSYNYEYECYELKSIDGSRKMYVKNNLSESITVGAKDVNATLNKCISFAEACLAIGRVDLLTKLQVFVQEIYEVLTKIQGGFYFLGKTDITLNELLELIKQRSQEENEIGGRQLNKHLLNQK